ncbi:MAG: energy transducer TonB, partial [Candidatus Acidiferrales bacterium]
STSARVHVDGVIQEQKLVRKVYGVYPLAAETANITGTVVFRVVVAKDGTVESVEYLSGPSVLVESAESSVKEYRYSPTLIGKTPVEVETTVGVPFVLPQ